MSETQKPLLIKRYASRRLYNTEASDYVTLEDIAGFIRKGRDVQIIDLKTGEDLTRQYLLQIVAEHESRGENVLPVSVLTDLVRSYASGMQSIMPQFLSSSFDMLRESQSRMIDNLSHLPSPVDSIPGFQSLRKQQEAFLRSVMAAWPGGGGGDTAPAPARPAPAEPANGDEIAEIRRQLAELQAKLANFRP